MTSWTHGDVGGPPPARCRGDCIGPKIAARAPLLQEGRRPIAASLRHRDDNYVVDAWRDVGGPPPARCREDCIGTKIAARAPLLQDGLVARQMRTPLGNSGTKLIPGSSGPAPEADDLQSLSRDRTRSCSPASASDPDPLSSARSCRSPARPSRFPSGSGKRLQACRRWVRRAR